MGSLGAGTPRRKLELILVPAHSSKSALPKRG